MMCAAWIYLFTQCIYDALKYVSIIDYIVICGSTNQAIKHSIGLLTLFFAFTSAIFLVDVSSNAFKQWIRPWSATRCNGVFPSWRSNVTLEETQTNIPD